MTDQPDYKIGGPLPVSQVCLRCGAEVGSRAIHDVWHLSLTGGSTTESDSALPHNAPSPASGS